eukprot:m.209522 g.209522  ORF g.209522 m.209522 type:complete len:320 (+) comp25465_c0_seq1:162-1121(+)
MNHQASVRVGRDSTRPAVYLWPGFCVCGMWITLSGLGGEDGILNWHTIAASLTCRFVWSVLGALHVGIHLRNCISGVSLPSCGVVSIAISPMSSMSLLTVAAAAVFALFSARIPSRQWAWYVPSRRRSSGSAACSTGIASEYWNRPASRNPELSTKRGSVLPSGMNVLINSTSPGSYRLTRRMKNPIVACDRVVVAAVPVPVATDVRGLGRGLGGNFLGRDDIVRRRGVATKAVAARGRRVGRDLARAHRAGAIPASARVVESLQARIRERDPPLHFSVATITSVRHETVRDGERVHRKDRVDGVRPGFIIASTISTSG